MSAAGHSHSCRSTPLLRNARRFKVHTVCNSRLQQCRAVQSLEVAQSTDSSSKNLVEWMQQQGASIDGVQLAYDKHPDGSISRELRATQDLSPGDVVMSVPLSCCIHYVDNEQQHSSCAGGSNGSSSGSRSATALRRLQASVPAASDSGRGAWQFKVALEILYHYHQGSSSPLCPYIQNLPGVYPGIPGPQVAMLYPEHQLQELQYPTLIADAGSQHYWLKQYSSDVLAQLPGSADDPFGGHCVTQEQLGWALSVAMSRAFGFKRLGGWALVPLVDMANHALTSNAEIRFDAGGRAVRMIANKQVTAGSPIFLKYGSHDNSNLLLSYGFVLPDNPADKYTCQLDMDLLLAAVYQFVGGELPPSGRATDGLKQWQRTTLQQLGLLGNNSSNTAVTQESTTAAAAEPATAAGGSSEQQPTASGGGSSAGPVLVQIGGDPPVSAALLAAVRVALATDRASVKGKTLEQLGDWQQPLSTTHEALVMKALVGFVTVIYKSFPTSIQADRALLAQLQQRDSEAAVAAAAAVGADAADAALYLERLSTAVQFRLGMKLLLERSTKALIVRLQGLLQ